MKYSVRVCDHCARGPINFSIYFTMRIILGTVLVTYQVLPVSAPGTIPDSSRTCEFRRKPFNFVSAPSIRLSVLVISWDIFLVTVLSISTENCVRYTSLILGALVSLDKLFEGSSIWPSLLTAANFLSFPEVAIGKMNLLHLEKFSVFRGFSNL